MTDDDREGRDRQQGGSGRQRSESDGQRSENERVPGVRVREASEEEFAAVLNVLDGAALSTDAGQIAAGIERGDVLVAVSSRESESADGSTETVLGALVLDGAEIESVAVRRRRRGQGIGRQLVAAAADRRKRLVATFRGEVRPFYERLGFDVEPIAPDGLGSAEEAAGRYRGRLDAAEFERP